MTVASTIGGRESKRRQEAVDYAAHIRQSRDGCDRFEGEEGMKMMTTSVNLKSDNIAAIRCFLFLSSTLPRYNSNGFRIQESDLSNKTKLDFVLILYYFKRFYSR